MTQLNDSTKLNENSETHFGDRVSNRGIGCDVFVCRRCSMAIAVAKESRLRSPVFTDSTCDEWMIREVHDG